MSLIRTTALLVGGVLIFAAAPDSGAQSQAAPIYGAELMTEEEQQQYRERLRALKGKERAAFRKEHRERMQDRARERGVAIPSGPAPGARGRDLMTKEEREMRSKTRSEERERARKEHHEEMKERAREQGIELPDEPPPRGRGPGGPGRGPGGGGRGPGGRGNDGS